MKNIPNMPGVYSITNIKNGKRYIGSTKHLRKRRNEHFSDLRNGSHTCIHLQNSWNKHGGEPYFKFEVLEVCLNETMMLRAREQYWIDKYKGRLYNSSEFAERFSTEWHQSEEGTERHKRHSIAMKEIIRNLEPVEYTCLACGNNFTRKSFGVTPKFCNDYCRIRHAKMICAVPDHISYIEKRECILCCKEFIVPSHTGQQACSLSCSLRYSKTPIRRNDIPVICKRIADMEPMTKIAKDYGVSSMQIQEIGKRRRWDDVEIPEDIDELLKKRFAAGSRMPKTVRLLSDETARSIKQMLADGDSVSDIACVFNVDKGIIRAMKRGETYKDITIDES